MAQKHVPWYALGEEKDLLADEGFNGWTNYATWGVAFVLDKDEGTYNYVRERLAEIMAEPNASEALSDEENVRYSFADFLREFTEDLCGLSAELGIREPSLMARQVLAAGLAEVDWQEIADSILSQS